MKTKVGTVLDKETVQKLREHSAKEGRSMNEIIHDALADYFQGCQKQRDSRRAAVERLCSRPFQLSSKEFNEILEVDYFEQ